MPDVAEGIGGDGLVTLMSLQLDLDQAYPNHTYGKSCPEHPGYQTGLSSQTANFEQSSRTTNPEQSYFQALLDQASI